MIYLTLTLGQVEPTPKLQDPLSPSKTREMVGGVYKSLVVRI